MDETQIQRFDWRKQKRGDFFRGNTNRAIPLEEAQEEERFYWMKHKRRDLIGGNRNRVI